MKNLLIFFFVCLSMFTNAQNALVKTLNGKVQGTTNAEKTIRIFKGIPFAASPVGDLRWKAPQPAQNWKGTKQCTTFSASPIQNKPQPFLCWSEEFIAQPEPLSEDCLYLNIWSSAKAKKEKQPVFLWIYGGGLSSGSANCAIYDGEEMAKKGVIFVSINYRVGVLGFMAHPELSKESGNTSGNYGILDQIAALKWVQKNIASFGGDPNNVTIAGQSAGAFSVTALIASPLAKGLFHKAIPQSGGLLGNMLLSQNLAKAEAVGLHLMKKANTHSIAELRKKSAEELQIISNNQEIGRFGITLDGYTLPVNLMEHFKKGLHNQTPVLTGWVIGDGTVLGASKMNLEDYKKEAQSKYGDKADAYLSVFPALTDDEVKIVKQKLSLLGFAGLPSHLLAGFNMKTTYMYEFGHVPPDKPDFPNYGAFHTAEVPYTLHNLHTWKRDWQPLDKDLENMMSSYWVNFAKTGNPNGTNLPEWKSYDKQSGHIMLLGDKVEMKAAFLKKEFDFLEKN